MSQKSIPIGPAFKYGWEAFRARPWFFFGVVAIQYAFQLVLSLAATLEPSEILLFLLEALSWFVQMILALGLLKIFLYTYEQQQAKFSDLFSQSKLAVNGIIASILLLLIILGGLVLFIIPGIIWMLKYQFALYFVVDKGMKPIEALKASAQITDGVKWELLGFNVVAILLGMLGTIFFFVGVFITTPIIGLATTMIYRKLSEETSAESTSSSAELK